MKRLTKKLPGTQRIRHKAKYVLKCKRVSEGMWIVWGGRSEHTIKVNGKNYSCDCDRFVKQKGLCSHIVRVTMEQRIFPTNRDDSSKYWHVLD